MSLLAVDPEENLSVHSVRVCTCGFRGNSAQQYNHRKMKKREGDRIGLFGHRIDFEATAQAQLEMQYDIDEAKAEINRHHKDFARISDALEAFFSNDHPTLENALETLKSIRNVVG